MKRTITPDEGRNGQLRVVNALDGLSVVRMSHLECEAHRPMDDGAVASLVTQLGISGQQQPGGELVTVSKYQVTAMPDDDESEELEESEAYWTVAVTFVAHWKLKEDAVVSDDDVHCFAIGQGSMTCHPYARECIQSATSRMGFPNATIDLLINPWVGDGVEIDIPETE